MGYIILIAVLGALATASYFIIKGGNEQLDELDEDPTITCWDDDTHYPDTNF
jgi:hypothetical protein